MKRLTTLALVVLALAAVPAALADDGTTPAQPASAPAATQQRHGGAGDARTRVEILRLRLQIVKLRFRLHCGAHGKAPAERCTAFAQKVEDRLTKLDGNVKSKLDELKACTADSSDGICRNAERKVAVFTKIDARLQQAIAKVQAWLDGTGPASDASSDSSLDQAASGLGQLAGSNG
jgi:hypothetical protein